MTPTITLTWTLTLTITPNHNPNPNPERYPNLNHNPNHNPDPNHNPHHNPDPNHSPDHYLNHNPNITPTIAPTITPTLTLTITITLTPDSDHVCETEAELCWSPLGRRSSTEADFWERTFSCWYRTVSPPCFCVRQTQWKQNHSDAENTNGRWIITQQHECNSVRSIISSRNVMSTSLFVDFCPVNTYILYNILYIPYFSVFPRIYPHSFASRWWAWSP